MLVVFVSLIISTPDKRRLPDSQLDRLNVHEMSERLCIKMMRESGRYSYDEVYPKVCRKIIDPADQKSDKWVLLQVIARSVSFLGEDTERPEMKSKQKVEKGTADAKVVKYRLYKPPLLQSAPISNISRGRVLMKMSWSLRWSSSGSI